MFSVTPTWVGLDNALSPVMVTAPKCSPAESDDISTVTSTRSGAVPDVLSRCIQLGTDDALQVIAPEPIFFIVNTWPAGTDPSVEVNVNAEGVGVTDSWGIAVWVDVDGLAPRLSRLEEEELGWATSLS